MRQNFTFAGLLALLAALAAPLRADPAPVTVFAAASLRGVLEEIAAGYGAPVTLSYGGSGTMARQVAAGAPADLAILASPEWMNWLVAQAVPSLGPPRMVAGNALVVIGVAGAPDLRDPAELSTRLGQGRLAMGQRDAVPAGSYARQWLVNAGLWDALEPKLAETDDVRAALALVARGQAPLGVVYATDARADPAVRVVYTVPSQTHDPILYPAAALSPAGEAFLAYLATPEAARAFAARGFTPVTP